MPSPRLDAIRAKEYFDALLEIGVEPEDAKIFTVAWIQSESMRQQIEAPEPPGPRKVPDAIPLPRPAIPTKRT